MQPRSPDPEAHLLYGLPDPLPALLACLVVAFFALPAAGQEASGPEQQEGEPIQVLPVGSFHFSSAPDFNDPMAPKQQAEIRAVVDSLLDFRPTKVAIERELKDSTTVDSLYEAYQAGRHELDVGETQQLGFRLTRRSGHGQVYPIDYKLAWPMDTVNTWAKRHQPSFLRFHKRWGKEMEAITDSLHRNGTLREILLRYNSEEFLSRIQAARMRTLEVGAGENYIGVEPPASIARRNMRIFANLLGVVEPGDRVLIIYGTGHIHFFREYVRGHPKMELVYPQEYL
jgi:hypothetical protein